jgi:hypothetical protein
VFSAAFLNSKKIGTNYMANGKDKISGGAAQAVTAPALKA